METQAMQNILDLFNHLKLIVMATLISSKTLFITMALAWTISSCGHKTEGGETIPVPRDTSSLAKINHFIPVQDIEAFKSAFAFHRDSLARVYPSLMIPISETFNKQALINILKDSTNVGMRIYYGVKAGDNRNELRLILVGVNSQGQDLYYRNGGEQGKLGAKLPPPPLDGGAEYGQCTPPCFQQPQP